MPKAIFLGLSAVFFIAYAAIANALLIPSNSQIVAISVPNQNATDTDPCADAPVILLPGDPCYTQQANRIPIVRNIAALLTGVTNILSAAGTLFSGFFQLITFQAPGLESASMITAIIFVPLTFVNGYIVFTAIRGSS